MSNECAPGGSCWRCNGPPVCIECGEVAVSGEDEVCIGCAISMAAPEDDAEDFTAAEEQHAAHGN
jgi:hypothetical protein